MKQTLCLLAALFCIGLTVTAAPRKRVEVNSIEQLIAAIDDNRIIVITEETLNITAALTSGDFDNLLDATHQKVYFIEEFDGPELHIAHVKNLSIEAGDEVVTLLSDPRYANVISFEDCTNLTLTGITFGHSEEGYCSQGVLGFYHCQNVTLDRVDMFGCGTEGIIVEDCTDMLFKASKIRDCSYHIMHLSRSRNVRFDDCQFFRNREFEQVNIYSCDNVTFNNCTFANNTGLLFHLRNTQVILRDSVILHDFLQFGDEDTRGNIIMVNCITEEYFHSEQALG